jgi:hypothetical protein
VVFLYILVTPAGGDRKSGRGKRIVNRKKAPATQIASDEEE